MDTLTFDFETYFDPKEFSLSKMTVTEYVRDVRFQPICCGFKLNDEPTVLAWGNDIAKAFSHYGTNVRAICHNSQFDGVIAAWRYNWRPAEWFDTVCMARAKLRLPSYSLSKVATSMGFGDKLDGLSVSKGKRLEDLQEWERNVLGTYCVRDVDLTKKIYDALIETGFSKFEHMLLEWTIRAVTDPLIAVDYEMLDNYIVELSSNKEKILTEAGITIEEIMSNPKFAAALERLGVKPPMKVSAKTGKDTFAFAKDDKGMTDLLEHPNPKVQMIVGARLKLKSTIEETRAARLSAIGKTGLLPIPLLYYGAHTGRLSGGGGINMQNLTRGSKLRKSIIAPPGMSLVVGDSSQIEARILAAIADQDDLVQIFRDGKDPYCDMASFIYGREITKKDEAERWLGKVVVLGAGYGMSANTFKEFLRTQGKVLEPHMYKLAIDAYRKKNYKIVKFWDTCDRAIKFIHSGEEFDLSPNVYARTGKNKISLPVGFPLLYPDLAYNNSSRNWEYSDRAVGKTGLYGGKVTENIVQSLARHVVMEQLLIAHQKWPVAMTVHDEIVCVVPEDQAQQARDEIYEIMCTPPRWWPDLPVKAEVKHGRVYGDIK